MFRLIPILILIGFLWFAVAWLRRLPPGQKRRTVMQILFGLLLVVLVFLTVTGRIHWLGALLAALLPFAKVALGLAVQILPFLKNHKGESQATSMTAEEAADFLGLKQAFETKTLTEQDVVKAHKSLMQKVHPDRGGNDYLAARVNQAKDVLLRAL